MQKMKFMWGLLQECAGMQPTGQVSDDLIFAITRKCRIDLTEQPDPPPRVFASPLSSAQGPAMNNRCPVERAGCNPRDS